MQKRFLIILALIILGEVYSFILVRSSVRSLPNPWRSLLLGFYVLATALTWASLIFFRRIDWAHLPHLSRNIFVAFTLGFLVAKILVATIMLIDDLRRIILGLSLKFSEGLILKTEARPGMNRSQFLKSLALFVGGISISGFVYGITNRYNYRVRKLAIRFDHLPPSFRGLRIVQISDIHSGSFDQRIAVAKGVEMALNLKPDIIFFTGDLVNNKADEIVPYLDIFSKLKAPLGVYSTLGNHDYGDYITWTSADAKNENLQTLKKHHAEMGWRLLMNEHVLIEKGNEKIAVIGIENWGAKAGFPKYGDMRKAYQGLSEADVPFKILLSHDPSHFDAQVVPQYPDIDLTLSGHTHGMQFGVEIPGLKWSPIQYVYSKWAGLYKVGKQHLYVNRGFGFLGYPGRIGILPEITLIELT
ncbi:MAG: metallophosphoesterase [Bacteroidetes bacterium]|nr:metallophosphoesterase [Bacteroidota bacterium]